MSVIQDSEMSRVQGQARLNRETRLNSISKLKTKTNANAKIPTMRDCLQVNHSMYYDQKKDKKVSIFHMGSNLKFKYER